MMRDDDPPEYPEPPECCDQIMVDFPDGICVCEVCGLRAKPYSDYPDEPDIDMPLPDIPNTCRGCGAECGCVYCDKCAETTKCSHGNLIGECAECDYQADLAYTAYRER